MKKKGIIVSILAIVILLCSIVNVFAAPTLGGNDDDDDNDIGILDGENDNDNENENENENERNMLANQNTNQSVNRNNSVSLRNNTNGMPDTGIEDTPFIAIGACIVVAVIAYTKIRKYNV